MYGQINILFLKCSTFTRLQQEPRSLEDFDKKYAEQFLPRQIDELENASLHSRQYHSCVESEVWRSAVDSCTRKTSMQTYLQQYTLFRDKYKKIEGGIKLKAIS